MHDIVIGYALLQHGAVQRLGRTAPSAEGALLPQGESYPPLDHWLKLMVSAQTVSEVQEIVGRARQELDAWRRRPEPPPSGESFTDLKRRIVDEGEGWTPQEVALAMRCTPTLVRHVRSEVERDAEYGRPDRSLAHGLALLRDGVTLRAAALATGIPKSTLHEAYRRAA
jgi:hypothetical protein